MQHNAEVVPPTRLGRYVVRRRLGAGGFATVWLAYDDQLDSPVAVKVLADNWTEDAHVRSRFLGEGRLLRRVESAHVVPVYDAGELDDGRPYLVMAYADQGTLADRLEGGAPMTSDEAAAVIQQIGAGLTALHELDVLHRDVKPANVLFRTVHGRVHAMLGDKIEKNQPLATLEIGDRQVDVESLAHRVGEAFEIAETSTEVPELILGTVDEVDPTAFSSR